MKETELRITNEGLNKIRRMYNAEERLERANSELNSASCEISNAKNELIKWLVPQDAKAGEIFCLAVGKYFLEARVRERETQISWRGGASPSRIEIS